MIPGWVVLAEAGCYIPLDDYSLSGFVHGATGKSYSPFLADWLPGVHTARLRFAAYGGALVSPGSGCEVELKEECFLFRIHHAHRIRLVEAQQSELVRARCVWALVRKIRNGELQSLPRWEQAAIRFAEKLWKGGGMLKASEFDISWKKDEWIEEQREAIRSGRSTALFFEAKGLVGIFCEDQLRMVCREPADGKPAQWIALAREVFARFLLGEFESTLDRGRVTLTSR